MKELSVGTRNIVFLQGDITHEETDAIVSAAHRKFRGHALNKAVSPSTQPADTRRCSE